MSLAGGPTTLITSMGGKRTEKPGGLCGRLSVFRPALGVSKTSTACDAAVCGLLEAFFAFAFGFFFGFAGSAAACSLLSVLSPFPFLVLLVLLVLLSLFMGAQSSSSETLSAPSSVRRLAVVAQLPVKISLPSSSSERILAKSCGSSWGAFPLAMSSGNKLSETDLAVSAFDVGLPPAKGESSTCWETSAVSSKSGGTSW
mmetsp:Transcript_53703/g.125186  ORF Transcript_53703/g.125186 Transcript_53703/m.125186 type:complete len:200 (-) Transcript_53703:191-790(-)